MRRFLSADAAVTAGILVMVLAATTARSFLTPLFSSGDEMAHFDYAVQVWHGDLPVFEDGLQVELPWGVRPSVQWTSQHPPLFYLLLAPIVGPLYDTGHPYLAGMAGRMVNTLIAAALCAAVMWAVRPLCGGRRWLPWIAGLAAASSPWVMGVGSAIYNDDIAALEITVVLGAALRLITLPREGTDALAARTGTWWVLGVAAVAAASTRLALMPIVAVVFGPLVLRGLLAPGPLPRRSWLLRPVIIGLAMIAATGWFYLRNVRLTGTVAGGHPEWAMANTDRTPPPAPLEVAADPVYWAKLLGIFSPGNTPDGLTLWALLVAPALLGAVLAIVLGAASRRGRGTPHGSHAAGAAEPPAALAGVVMLAAVSGLLVAMQFVYVSAAAGNLYPRYSLPILSVTCLLIAWGLGGLRRAAPFLLLGWSATAWWQIVVFLLGRPQVAAKGQAELRPDLALPLLGVAVAAAAVTVVVVLIGVLRTPRPAPGGPGRRARRAAAPA